jgi:type II secretory pathway component GspD/PulD (secretin)
MKIPNSTPLLCLGLALLGPALRAQDPAAPAKDYEAMARALLAQSAPPPPAAEATFTPAPPIGPRVGGGPGRNQPPEPATLRFNFRGAPLDTVLNYLSEAAGYVIVLDTPVRGTIDMWSAQPVTRTEAVQLLNQALNKHGYTATLKGRTLTVASKEEARKKNIPIRTGNDPREIPDNAEMVMQIIPLERIDASQAAADLATLLPSSATITANQDSNSLVVTDTQSNIRHIVELISALDGSAGSVGAMKVFQLKNADPTEMASLITNLFGTPTTGANRAGAAASPFAAFGGPGGPGAAAAAAIAAARGGNRGTTGGRTSRTGTSSSAGSRGTPVVAVADPRTYSVIVTASRESLDEIGQIIAQLDASPARKQKVFVYTLENGDVKQVEAILRNLFQSSNQRTTTSQQVDPLTTRASSNSQANGSNITLGTNGAR